MDKIIIQDVVLHCSVQRAFAMFTENINLEKWLTVKADVVAKVGGKYELFWDTENPEIDSTIGCKILALNEPCYLNFEWKGPEQYEHIMNNLRPLTNVTVIFNSISDKTEITLIHTGWRDIDEWEEARKYFIKAWNYAFKQLEKYVNG